MLISAPTLLPFLVHVPENALSPGLSRSIGKRANRLKSLCVKILLLHRQSQEANVAWFTVVVEACREKTAQGHRSGQGDCSWSIWIQGGAFNQKGITK